MKRFYYIFGISFMAILVPTGCNKQSAPTKATSPAEVSKKITETELITIKLTGQAEQRLGIAVVEVKKEVRRRFREYAGNLLLPLGESPDGSTNNSSRSVFSLLPVMTPADFVRVAELQVEADGQVSAAEVELTGARIALKRAEELIASKAGAGRNVDDARLQVQLAEAKLETAKSRRALLGAPLFSAVRSNVLWVHVPIYVGDIPKLDLAASARLHTLGTTTNTTGMEIRPVQVPFSTAGPAASTDVYYELSDGESYRPGQKFAVAIPLRAEDESLVVPASAILYDVHGDAWVYVKMQPQTFARHRVEVRYSWNGEAVLSRGLKEGLEVVTAGAAELFGTEFGPGK